MYVYMCILWYLGTVEGAQSKDQAGNEGPKPQTAVYFTRYQSILQVHTSARGTSKKGGRSRRGPRVRRAAHSTESGSSVSFPLNPVSRKDVTLSRYLIY